MKGLVRITPHAIRRARERFPELDRLRHEDLCRTIVAEVGEAVDLGRMAKKEPRWTANLERPRGTAGTPRGKDKSRLNRRARFAWTPDHRRVYVIDRGNVTTVITVIRGIAEPEEAAA